MTSLAENTGGTTLRRFEFERDRFGFANELLWEYRHAAPGGRTVVQPRTPKPDYVLRCFVLVRAARQFLYHARFEPELERADEATYRRLVRAVLARNPRHRSLPDHQITIPGYAGLRDFSAAWEALLKREGGGAWRSYVLRSHWRMVLPISRAHQARTARQLVEALQRREAPAIHLVRFPRLDMNHGMILFDAVEDKREIGFRTYDPNDPEKPSGLTYDRARRTFFLPANLYWAGGSLNIIEIFRSWWL